MKKLLVLTLVLGIASLASAALTFTAPATAVEGTQFNVVVSGGADEAYSVGLYETGYAAIGTPDGVVLTDAAGNLGSSNIYPSFGGFDFVIGDVEGDGVLAGDWVIATYTAGAAGGQLVLDLFDYNAGSAVTPAVAVIDFITPEPATMALLGLGALVLRRKK